VTEVVVGRADGRSANAVSPIDQELKLRSNSGDAESGSCWVKYKSRHNAMLNSMIHCSMMASRVFSCAIINGRNSSSSC
jgi:hypothetical protein